MENKEILEYNKRCAEFLGVNKTLSSYYLPKFGLYVNKYGEVYYEEVFREEELKFHSDWNWIMEVVEAIVEKTKFKTIEECSENEWYATIGITKLAITFKKEAVVQAINRFLIWYQNNK